MRMRIGKLRFIIRSGLEDPAGRTVEPQVLRIIACPALAAESRGLNAQMSHLASSTSIRSLQATLALDWRSLFVYNVLLARIFQPFCCTELWQRLLENASIRDQETHPPIATSARARLTNHWKKRMLDAAHAPAVCERKFVALEVASTDGLRNPGVGYMTKKNDACDICTRLRTPAT